MNGMKSWTILMLVLAAPQAPGGETPPPAGQIVWHFDGGIMNELGGRYNVFKREPSWARTYLDSRVTRARHGYSLRVTAHRDAKGFCGVWLDFHPGSEGPRRFLDASHFRYLSFWAKGEKGGEDFEVSLTDEATIDKDERPTRRVGDYFRGGLSTQWRQIVIPLSDFDGIDPSRLVRMTLKLARRGDARFHLDDIGFLSAPAADPGSETRRTSLQSVSTGGAGRAMWAWNTKGLFDSENPEQAERFLTFCEAHQIKDVYLAAEFDRIPEVETPRLRLRNADAYRAFLQRAHQRGLRVEALAGTPEWAVRANHPEAVAAVDAIVEFQNGGSPGERFEGIHYDVEPYLLAGFGDSDFRPEILRGLVEVAEKCRDRAHAGGLTFSCDMPSWFFSARGGNRDEWTVSFGGQSKTVGEHMTDLADSVTIMDYTNQADGAGGIIARALPALEYAATRNKKIVVGVETFSERDSTVSFILGLPAKEFWPRLAASGLRGQLHYEGFKMSVKNDGEYVHMGLSTPRNMNPEKQAAFKAALSRLARQLSSSFEPERYPLPTIMKRARASFSQNPDWKDFEPCEYPDSESSGRIQGFRCTYRMQPNITFYGLGRETFDEEIASAVEWLGRHPGFGGMAVHAYESFRELMEGKSGAGNQKAASAGN